MSKYKLKADMAVAWTRRGSDFYNPKYRSILSYSLAILCGILVALVLSEAAGMVVLPVLIVWPVVAGINVVMIYVMYRLLLRERNHQCFFRNMHFEIDFDVLQLYCVTDDGSERDELFGDKGFYRALQRGENTIIFQGTPNRDFVTGLEKRFTPYKAPSMAYCDFVVGLTIDDNNYVAEIVHKLRELDKQYAVKEG